MWQVKMILNDGINKNNVHISKVMQIMINKWNGINNSKLKEKKLKLQIFLIINKFKLKSKFK